MFNNVSISNNLNLKPINQTNHVSFSYLFVSLFSPYIINDIKLFFNNPTLTDKKIVLKQSYVLLTWFYYLKIISIKKKLYDSRQRLKFFVMPIKRQVYTLTLAPIAHKLWSREQYKFHYYFIRISFKNCSLTEYSFTNLNQILLILLVLKLKITPFETNLMFIKHMRTSLTLSDSQFFNYYHFLNQ